mmetsp:Transcript_12538/g.17424  ORF Transcript_12538/g.17424 Transcript_12538/m.17424 type:complete len:312 (+) Transcript_12538:43-978(+)
MPSKIPTAIQHALRDSGVGRFFCNLLSYITGFSQLICTKAAYLNHFLRPSKHVRSVKYGTHSSQFLDVIPCESKLGKDAPVIAFVHGGAWGSGHPYMYRLLGVRLAMEGFHCILIGYRTYPCADILGQLDDVQEALSYIRRRIGFGELSSIGKNSQIYLSGHSSGAHVVSQCVLERSKSLDFIQGVIGLGGAYDLKSQYECEKSKDVHELSPLKAANKGVENFHRFSPYVTASKLERKHASSVPKFLLLHGLKDTTVPPSQSENLMAVSKGKFRCEIELLDGIAHADIVTDMFDLEKEIKYLERIKKFCNM